MGAAPAALADASVISTMSAWIEQALRPISDADPAVLSKYVLALLKKDTPLDTMRANCVKELEDFLEDKTRGFVDALFRNCLLYTSPSPRDLSTSRMPSSA